MIKKWCKYFELGSAYFAVFIVGTGMAYGAYGLVVAVVKRLVKIALVCHPVYQGWLRTTVDLGWIIVALLGGVMAMGSVLSSELRGKND